MAGIGLIVGIVAFTLGFLTLAMSFIPIINICTCFTLPAGFFVALAGIVISIIALVMGAGSAKMKAILGLVLSCSFFLFGILQIFLAILLGIGQAIF